MGMSVTISAARTQDAEQILKLQYLCYQSEAELYGDYGIEPLTQSLEDLRAEIADGHALVARLGDEVVASVRGKVDADGTARIAKLIVHPRMQRHGLGGRLLDAIERHFAADAGRQALPALHRAPQREQPAALPQPRVRPGLQRAGGPAADTGHAGEGGRGAGLRGQRLTAGNSPADQAGSRWVR